jgi:hypothetical protein
MRACRLSGPAACLFFILSFAAGGNRGNHGGVSISKTTGDDLYRPFLINNVFNYYGNIGDGSYNKFSASGEAFEFLKGTGRTTVFEDGVDGPGG